VSASSSRLPTIRAFGRGAARGAGLARPAPTVSHLRTHPRDLPLASERRGGERGRLARGPRVRRRRGWRPRRRPARRGGRRTRSPAMPEDDVAKARGWGRRGERARWRGRAATVGGARRGHPVPGTTSRSGCPWADRRHVRWARSRAALARRDRGDGACCTRCPLYKTATHGVPGRGVRMPTSCRRRGAREPRRTRRGGRSSGASGQLLTKILAAINLRREDVFICNVVKHRPPGNRNPAPDEVAACSPYLIRQLELVRPKVILTVGNFAAQTLLDTKLGIGKLRGQVHLYRGCRSWPRTTPPRSCATPPGSAPPGKMSSLPVDFSIAPPPRVDPVPRPPAAVLAGRRAGGARRDAPRPGRDPARRRARRRHDVLPRGAPPDLPRGPRPLGARRGRRAADARRGAGAPRELEASGGKEYIATSSTRCPTAANVEYHAKIVREKAVLRRLIEVSTAVVTDAFEGASSRASCSTRPREDLPDRPGAGRRQLHAHQGAALAGDGAHRGAEQGGSAVTGIATGSATSTR
jgi:uracil-DNA glycosylase family 4